MFKVIDTDNYARYSVADILVAEGFKTRAEAQDRADLQNRDRREHTPYWAVVVPQSQRLSRGMEDLV